MTGYSSQRATQAGQLYNLRNVWPSVPNQLTKSKLFSHGIELQFTPVWVCAVKSLNSLDTGNYFHHLGNELQVCLALYTPVLGKMGLSELQLRFTWLVNYSHGSKHCINNDEGKNHALIIQLHFYGPFHLSSTLKAWNNKQSCRNYDTLCQNASKLQAHLATQHCLRTGSTADLIHIKSEGHFRDQEQSWYVLKLAKPSCSLESGQVQSELILEFQTRIKSFPSPLAAQDPPSMRLGLPSKISYQISPHNPYRLPIPVQV